MSTLLYSISSPFYCMSPSLPTTCIFITILYFPSYIIGVCLLCYSMYSFLPNICVSLFLFFVLLLTFCMSLIINFFVFPFTNYTCTIPVYKYLLFAFHLPSFMCLFFLFYFFLPPDYMSPYILTLESQSLPVLYLCGEAIIYWRNNLKKKTYIEQKILVNTLNLQLWMSKYIKFR